MEAKFDDFDYGLVDSDGKIKIVARNEDTAFLTKYLRAYGGDGVYQNYKTARVLRNFRFSGIGNVDKPANPKSEYTKFDDYVFASSGEVFQDSIEVLFTTKGKVMEIKTLEDAKTVIADLTEKLSQHEGQAVENLKAQNDTFKASNQELADKLSAETGKLNVATQEIDALKASVEDLKTKVASATSERDAKAQELDNITKQAKAIERIAKLKELGVDVSTDEKKKEITEWTDAVFASVLEFTKTVKPQAENKGTGDSAAQATQALEGAKAEEVVDPTKTGGNQESEGDKLQKVAAKLIDNLRSKKNNPKSNKKE